MELGAYARLPRSGRTCALRSGGGGGKGEERVNSFPQFRWRAYASCGGGSGLEPGADGPSQFRWCPYVVLQGSGSAASAPPRGCSYENNPAAPRLQRDPGEPEPVWEHRGTSARRSRGAEPQMRPFSWGHCRTARLSVIGARLRLCATVPKLCIGPPPEAEGFGHHRTLHRCAPL